MLPEHTIAINDSTPTDTKDYLSLFSETELTELEEKYKLTRTDLNKLIENYWISLWYYRVENWLANLTNVLYVIFQVHTSNEGIESFAKAIYPDADVPSAVGYGIGTPFAIIEGSVFIFTFSAYKKALQSTLDYATRLSLRTRIANALAYACSALCEAMYYSLKYLINQTIKLVHNLTGTMSEIVDVANWMKGIHMVFFAIATPMILYFGNRYMSHYMNDDYDKGENFWKNKENRPWLLGEMRRGHIFVPLQTMLQGICAVGLKTFPSYYYLAVTAGTTIGFWFPAIMVAVSVAIHSFRTLYIESYNHYMDDKLAVRELIKKRCLERNEEITEKNIACHLASEEKIILQKHGRCYLFKNDIVSPFLVGFRSIIGGYLGAKCGLKLTSDTDYSIISATALGLVGAILFGGFCYRAEAQRVMPKLVRQKLEAQARDEELDEEQPAAPNRCATFAKGLANAFTFISVISGASAIIGTGTRLVGNDFVSIIAIAAVERAFNAASYTRHKVLDTVANLCKPSKARLSTTPSAFFSYQPIEEKQTSDAQDSYRASHAII